MKEILFLILTTYRLSCLLSYEAGPMAVLVRLRHFLGCRMVGPDTYERPIPGSWCDWALCPKCNSLVIAIVVVVLYTQFPRVVWPVMVILSISAVITLLVDIRNVLLRGL